MANWWLNPNVLEGAFFAYFFQTAAWGVSSSASPYAPAMTLVLLAEDLPSGKLT